MSSEFIYLDWNVVKYIKENYNQQSMYSVIDWLKGRYYFPFSFAQICDRQRGEEEYIREDLDFLKELSEGYMVGIDDENDSFDISKKNIIEKYNEVKQYRLYDLNMADLWNGILTSEILEEIFAQGIEEFFSKSRNVKFFVPFIYSALSRFDSNSVLYKEFRRFMIEYGKSIEDKNQFINLIVKDSWERADIAQILKDFNRNFDKKESKSENMRNLFLLLEFKQYYKNLRINDKITNKNSFSNIYTDSEHMLVAQYSKCFVTNDKKLSRKIRLVFDYFKVDTIVVDMNEFVSHIAREL